MASDPDIGTPKGDRLDVLVTLVQSFESQHFPMPLPDPIEAINFRMEQQGLKPKDLEPMIGKSNRVYEQQDLPTPFGIKIPPSALLSDPTRQTQ
jgi:HTH-type transcriptional regulator/antitoxin HigA